MLKQALHKYLLVTIISLAMTYGAYYLMLFAMGHSLLFFAFFQLIGFIFILNRYENEKENHINDLYEMVTSFQQGKDGPFRTVQPDNDFYALSSKIKELKQKYQEEIYVYRQAHQRFLHILQNIKSAVILLDNEGKVQFINSSGEDIFLVNRVEVLTKTHWKFGRESGLSEKIDHVRKTGQAIQTEIQLEYPLPRLLETTISPIKSENKSLFDVVILLHDVTERGQMEQLRRELVANVSHELKTPLTSIKGFTETLLDGAIEDREHTELFLNIISRETNRLQEMVDSILDLSTIESKGIKFTQVDLVQIVSQSIEEMNFLANEKDITISCLTDAPEIFISADENRMKQVIINLLSNSIKYSNNHKQIVVQVKESQENIQLSVKDQGIGIPPEHLDRVFERFYRVDSSRNQKSGGRGIGLSIVKQIIKQLGGHIQIKSSLHTGTRITIIFSKDRLTGT
jgi:two-component system phosphate regulon sensor histidine kinase PhoR